MIAPALMLSLLAASPKPRVVVFAAPESLRAPMASAISAAGATPIDASEVYDALFGVEGEWGPIGGGAIYRIHPGAKPFKLDAALPEALRAEFDRTLGLCLSLQRKPPKKGEPFCNGQLIGALWQRHLERLKATEVRVITRLLKPTPGADQTMLAYSVITNVYEPRSAKKHESNVSSAGSSASLEKVAAAVVALSTAETNMPRENSNKLPQ